MPAFVKMTVPGFSCLILFLGLSVIMENEPVLQEQLGARLELAKTGKHALNVLLHDYMPFIKKCVFGVFFKGQAKADNLTDAMLAFALRYSGTMS
jgi:hypothetical protein